MRRFSIVLCALVASVPALAQGPTAEEAKRFADEADRRLLELTIDSQRAQWVQATYITEDTQILAAQANERLTAATIDFAKQAARFNDVAVDPETARKLKLLRTYLVLPAPSEPAKTSEVTRLAASLDAAFGTGRWCRTPDDCLTIDKLERLMAESKNARELLDAWVGWRTVSAPMRADFERLAVLANEGARELGFADVGALWRSKYDMPPDDFARELDRLWGQVKPLYEALHCHVRARLAEVYGADVVKPGEPIPAHLLGNMWAQQWANIYPLVAPASSDPGFDLTERLKTKGVDEREMVRIAERFFTSLGFAPLPATFWERSQFTRPRDRDVVCHASAWDIDYQDDLRIKMCIGINDEDFITIHHELGHNFYQRAYNRLPFLYQDSANDGFHEAIGDTVALSVTPKYLKQIGMIDTEPDPRQDVGLLMRQALDKVAFLPFGLLIDQWRWKVYSGEVKPGSYNRAWWDLVEKYQGVAPPVARSEADFDPGAKYHVAGNVPYTRYFLAHILQFQFLRELCKTAGNTAPLHRCSIYGNAEAGERLAATLEMGLSRPWPDALEALSGSREMDATAIIDYFAPLKAWLDEQNRGRQCGW
ncbi:MAG TPA: M2 family metallopeptidase [Thermoanaerobaculia bacterium]|nr:M2 family metallopeptidase [Thermoanaerobaculia bacterium]